MVHDDAVQYLYGMEDQQKVWGDAVKRIDDRIVARAVEIGITGENYKRFDFDEFYIQDMYKSNKGYTCFLCKKGLRCDKH